jgi:acetyl esterase/lipase
MKRLLLSLILAFTARAADFTVEPDVEYGRVGEKKLLLDVYKPTEKSDKPRAAVILVHGGGWSGGKRGDIRDIGVTVAKHGYVGFAVSYRLVFGEEGRWPQQLDDVQRSVRWVRANAERFGIDPARVGAIGGSAGGHLVALLGTCDTRDNSDPALASHSSRVKCVVDMCGPTELSDNFEPKVPLGKLANELIRAMIGGTPAEKPDAVREASPITRIDSKTVPFLIVHGRKDRIVPPDQSEKFHAALQKAGIESKLLMFEDEDHGFTKKANIEKFAAETVAFLAKHLGK